MSTRSAHSRNPNRRAKLEWPSRSAASSRAPSRSRLRDPAPVIWPIFCALCLCCGNGGGSGANPPDATCAGTDTWPALAVQLATGQTATFVADSAPPHASASCLPHQVWLYDPSTASSAIDYYTICADKPECSFDICRLPNFSSSSHTLVVVRSNQPLAGLAWLIDNSKFDAGTTIEVQSWSVNVAGTCPLP